jgi:hypothetical protein
MHVPAMLHSLSATYGAAVFLAMDVCLFGTSSDATAGAAPDQRISFLVDVQDSMGISAADARDAFQWAKHRLRLAQPLRSAASPGPPPPDEGGRVYRVLW